MISDIKIDAAVSNEISKYLEILGQDPGSRAFAQLAEAYRKAGMLDEAIVTVKEGLILHPNYLSAIAVLGRCYYEKGMFREAEEEIGKVVKMAPDNIAANNLLGVIRQKIKEEVKVEEVAVQPAAEELTDAAEPLEEKKEVRPKKEITTETIAELYIKQGYFDRAVDIYQTLYNADPENEEIKSKLDELKVRAGIREPEVEVKEVEWVVPTAQEPIYAVESDDAPVNSQETAGDEGLSKLETWLKNIQSARRKG